MRVKNGQKESARIYLKNDLKSEANSLQYIEKNLRNIATAIDMEARDSRQGDLLRSSVEQCTHAGKLLKKCVQIAQQCQHLADRIDTTEEIPDDQY